MRLSLLRLQRHWARSVGAKGLLPWYAEEKLRAGAYSTLVGLTLADKSWEAMAIGDSCLFQIRGDVVITSFPLSRVSEFNNRPALMSTNSENWDREMEHVSTVQGSWQETDEFCLMTDAASCWFIGATENGLRPSESLDRVTDVSEIQSLRQSGAMRNDDVTVLRVCPT